MLDTADILVDRCPIIDFFLVERFIVIVRVRIAQVVPR